jgi:GNAT superfamily N-acetyltransferase
MTEKSKTLSISVKPVDTSNWADFEKLFRSKGGPNYCWCMVWRMTAEELKQNTSANRHRFIGQRVKSGIPIGLLAYQQDEPIAWCSVAPRETHLRLGGDETKEATWSLTCFFIKKEYRRQGMVRFLIDHAKEFAKRNGAHYLEAYPVAADSPSYRFMGFVPTFEQSGFDFVHMAGTRRHVMICKL